MPFLLSSSDPSRMKIHVNRSLSLRSFSAPDPTDPRRMPILAQVLSCSFLPHPPLPLLGCCQLQARWSTGSSVAAAYRPSLGRDALSFSTGGAGLPPPPRMHMGVAGFANLKPELRLEICLTGPSSLPVVLAFSPETSTMLLSSFSSRSQFLNLNLNLKLPTTTTSSTPELDPLYLRPPVSQREEEKTGAYLVDLITGL